MYSEGEHRYLKDLDWVNIVKSIRELKALSRVILNKYQQEILSFEKDSLLPSDEAYKNKKLDSIYDRLPLEYSGSIQQDEYKGKVVNFLEEYSSKELSNIDLKIIEEVQWFFCSFSFKLIKLIDM